MELKVSNKWEYINGMEFNGGFWGVKMLKFGLKSQYSTAYLLTVIQKEGRKKRIKKFYISNALESGKFPHQLSNIFKIIENTGSKDVKNAGGLMVGALGLGLELPEEVFKRGIHEIDGVEMKEGKYIV